MIEFLLYPELYAIIGSKTPDFRGYFLRGNGGNSAALGVAQGDAIRNITGEFTTDISKDGINHAKGAFYFKEGWLAGDGGEGRDELIGFDVSRVVPTANENRPVNKSVRYLIRSRS